MATIIQKLSKQTNEAITKIINTLPQIRLPSFHQCKAICCVNNERCPNYTKHTYCNDHCTIQKQFCKLYHLFQLRGYYQQQGMTYKDLDIVEVNMRIQYKQMFQLLYDKGHADWIDYLSSHPKPARARNDVYLPKYYRSEINEWLQDTAQNIHVLPSNTAKIVHFENEPPLFPFTFLLTKRDIVEQYFYYQIPIITAKLLPVSKLSI